MKVSHVISAVLLGAVISFPIAAFAENNSASIEKLIAEMADTPAHHQALAQYYKEKAEGAKKDLAEHKSRSNAYSGYSKNQSSAFAMRRHCDKLVSLFESEIKEYEGLAALHEEEYKKSLKVSDGK